MHTGSQVGSYEIVEPLGEGGFAQVFRVKHRVLGSDHALKVLRPELLEMEEVRQRFLDEARVQARLKHPNIVQVTDLIAEPGIAGFVMEFVEGASLGDEIERRIEADEPPSPAEIRAVFLAVLEAVGAAHAAGVVHRDLKPDNILLATDHRGALVPKVTDFGIAKVGGALKGKRKTTMGARTLGTLGYMSPEQLVSSKDVDARADIFSLGVALLEFATLESPFERDSEFLTMKAVHEADYEVPPSLEASDPVLVSVVQRALMVKPDQRYPDCAAMSAALRAAAPVRDRSQPKRGKKPTPKPAAPQVAAKLRPSAAASTSVVLGPEWPEAPRSSVPPGALRVLVEGPFPTRGVDLVARAQIGAGDGDTLTVRGPGVVRGHVVVEPTRHGWRVVAQKGGVRIGERDLGRGGAWIPDLSRETQLMVGSAVLRLSVRDPQAPVAPSAPDLGVGRQPTSTTPGAGPGRLPEGHLRVSYVNGKIWRDVGDRCSVGSSTADTLEIADPALQPRHVVIEREGSGWRVTARGGAIRLGGRSIEKGGSQLTTLSSGSEKLLVSGHRLDLLSASSGVGPSPRRTTPVPSAPSEPAGASAEPDDEDARMVRALIGGVIGFLAGLPAGGIGALPGAATGAAIGYWLPELLGCALLLGVVAAVMAVIGGGC